MFGLFSSKGQVSPDDIAKRLNGPDRPFIVDVREPGEYAQGHIPGSVLMPLGSLGQRMAELPKDRELVMVCRSGGRSGMATNALNQAGFKAVNMAGGMLSWRGPVER